MIPQYIAVRKFVPVVWTDGQIFLSTCSASRICTCRMDRRTDLLEHSQCKQNLYPSYGPTDRSSWALSVQAEFVPVVWTDGQIFLSTCSASRICTCRMDRRTDLLEHSQCKQNLYLSYGPTDRSSLALSVQPDFVSNSTATKCSQKLVFYLHASDKIRKDRKLYKGILSGARERSEKTQRWIICQLLH